MTTDMAPASRPGTPAPAQRPTRRPYATWISATLTVVLSCVVYRAYRSDQARSGSWGCEMSWMTPSYVRIPWMDAPSVKYDIYLYREQGWDLEGRVSPPLRNPAEELPKAQRSSRHFHPRQRWIIPASPLRCVIGFETVS